MSTSATDRREPRAEPIFLDIYQVAALTGLSRAMVYRLIAQGDMPSSKIGKSLRVHVKDFEAWAESKRALGGGR